MKKYLTATFIFLTIIAVIFAIGISISIRRPVVNAKEGIILNIPAGMSKQAMVAELKNRGILKNTIAYDAYIWAHRGAQIKTGEYFIPFGSSPYSIWQQVTQGRGFYYRSFMIVPGMTFAQLRQSIDATEGLRHMTQGATPETIMVFLGHPDLNPEGQFYPETYNFTRGDQDLIIYQRAFDLMQNRLNEAWAGRATDIPFKTKQEALIAASIVEKEAYLDSERPIIAGVMVNRLNVNMPLQFDPTVIYGLGTKYDGKIYKSDLLADTPYNTYLRRGLTPTPIAMPGMVSIEAVMHPAKHDFLYFVAKGDGGHQFSATLQEHDAAVQAARDLAMIREQSVANGFFNTALVQKYILRQASIAALETNYDAR